MKDKDFKRWLKRKIKVTLGVMISFLILGSLTYAANTLNVYVNSQDKTIKTEKEYQELSEEEKKKYKLMTLSLNGENEVTNSENVNLLGSGNEVTNSGKQNIIGDKNKIKERDAGTNSGKKRQDYDVVIGANNNIFGNHTYMDGLGSLTVIGNNNELKNVDTGIIIGNYQKFSKSNTEGETVVIGSLNPIDVENEKYQQAHKSVVVGYNAVSSSGYGVAVGHGAKAFGWESTVTGYNSVIDLPETERLGSMWGSIYGANNKISGINYASSIVGTTNKIEDASNSMIFGEGNKIKNANPDENEFVMKAVYYLSFSSQKGNGSTESSNSLMGALGAYGGGSMLTLGNGNETNYARFSQIVGSGNILKGTNDTTSKINNIMGYQNIGTNVSNMSIIGVGNKIENSNNDIIIGNYHEIKGGEHNIILGGTETKEVEIEKEYQFEFLDNGELVKTPLNAKFKTNIPVKKHTDNISNAVMLGYNTDVQKNGGVALGSNSISEIDKGVIGYNILTDSTHSLNNITTNSFVWKSTEAAISIGNTVEGKTRQIINLAAGTKDTDAVNVAQLKQARDLIPFEYALKEDTTKKVYTSEGKFYLVGDNTEVKKDEVFIKSKYNLQVGNIQSSMIEATTNPSSGSGDSTGASNKNDANSNVVIVKDLKDVKASVDKNTTDITNLTTKVTKNEGDIKTITTNISNITTNVTNINNKLEKIDKKADKALDKSNQALGGVSNAVAMANLPQVMGDKKFNLAASYGYYGGSHAVAIGFSGTNDKQNFIYKLSGSVNNKGNLAFGIGAGVMLGEVNNKDKKIENLEKTNKELLERVAKLEKLLSK